MIGRKNSARGFAGGSIALLCLLQFNIVPGAEAIQPKHFGNEKRNSGKTEKDKGENKKDASAKQENAEQAKAPKTVFIQDKFQLGKSLAKNGYHKGEPVVFVVDKGAHFTYVLQLQKNHLVQVYRASNSVGKDDTPTPYGPYHIVDKQKFPSWLPPKSIDPKQKPIPPYNQTHKNPLGVARMTLNKFGIALHGTNEPNSLRKDVSHGCIRHSNKDIMKLFSMAHVGDTVVITKGFAGTELGRDMFVHKKK